MADIQNVRAIKLFTHRVRRNAFFGKDFRSRSDQNAIEALRARFPEFATTICDCPECAIGVYTDIQGEP